MEGRKGKLNVSEMPITLLQGLSTCIADSVFTRYTHTTIEWPVVLYGALARQIEEVSVTYFKN